MTAVPESRDAVDLTTLSPNRVKIAQSCGLRFKYEYVDRIPAPAEAAYFVFGNVLHDATAEWYGPDDAPRDHAQTDLVGLVRHQWTLKLPPQILVPLDALIGAEAEAEALCQVLIDPKTKANYKQPRQTKAFLESAAAKQLREATMGLLDACDKYEAIKWSKSENPYQAWRKSLEIAAWMQRRWRPQPRPLAVEMPFHLRFDGVEVRGRIDQLRLDPVPGTGEAVCELWDMKSGQNLFTQQEAFVQMWLYHRAIRALIDEGYDIPLPEHIVLYMLRHDKPQRGVIVPERHDKIAMGIINRVLRDIAMSNYEPAYGYACQRCDYKDLCEKELSIWEPGTDGMLLSTT